MELHELCTMFPPATEPELADLAESIGESGLVRAITTYEGKILDGRNRYNACQIAEVTPRYEPYTGDDPLGFVLDVNRTWRNLKESQRAMVAARAVNTQGKGRPEKNVEISTITADKAAKKLNISRHSVMHAQVVLASGNAEMIQAVESGKLAVSKAVKMLKGEAGPKEEEPKPERIPTAETRAFDAEPGDAVEPEPEDTPYKQTVSNDLVDLSRPWARRMTFTQVPHSAIVNLITFYTIDELQEIVKGIEEFINEQGER
jgi:hypothetical protein